MTMDEKRADAERRRKEALVMVEIGVKFGERLRHYRSRLNITQLQLAKMAGITDRAVRRIESGNGGVTIKLRTFLQLSRALGVDPTTMIRGMRL